MNDKKPDTGYVVFRWSDLKSRAKRDEQASLRTLVMPATYHPIGPDRYGFAPRPTKLRIG